MKCDRRPRISFTSHVGMGSREHVLHGAEPISLATSSAVTVDQLLRVLMSRQRTSCDVVVAVEARTTSTLSCDCINMFPSPLLLVVQHGHSQNGYIDSTIMGMDKMPGCLWLTACNNGYAWKPQNTTGRYCEHCRTPKWITWTYSKHFKYVYYGTTLKCRYKCQQLSENELIVRKLIRIIKKFNPTYKTKYEFTKKHTVIAKSRCHLECPCIDDIGI